MGDWHDFRRPWRGFLPSLRGFSLGRTTIREGVMAAKIGQVGWYAPIVASTREPDDPTWLVWEVPMEERTPRLFGTKLEAWQHQKIVLAALYMEALQDLRFIEIDPTSLPGGSF